MIGGVYSVTEIAVGLILSGVDARRSSSNSMWEAESTMSYISFGAELSWFSTDLIEVRDAIS